MSFWVGFATGIAAVLAVWFVWRIIVARRVLKQYNEMMTEMFNAVPQNQRFGYEKDFPKNQKWNL